MCTGSLLAPTWVITAAHCQVDSVQYGDMTVIPSEATTISRLLVRIPHPNYATIKENDIALLLIQKVPVTRFGKLSALDYRSMYGLQVEWVGGGFTTWRWTYRNVVADYTRPLQLASGVIKRCEIETVGTHLCVASRCLVTQHVMPADSGGPLFLGDAIIGVAYSLERYNTISVFTAVSPYLPWIAKVMESHNDTHDRGKR